MDHVLWCILYKNSVLRILHPFLHFLFKQVFNCYIISKIYGSSDLLPNLYHVVFVFYKRSWPRVWIETKSHKLDSQREKYINFGLAGLGFMAYNPL